MLTISIRGSDRKGILVAQSNTTCILYRDAGVSSDQDLRVRRVYERDVILRGNYLVFLCRSRNNVVAQTAKLPKEFPIDQQIEIYNLCTCIVNIKIVTR